MAGAGRGRPRRGGVAGAPGLPGRRAAAGAGPGRAVVRDRARPAGDDGELADGASWRSGCPARRGLGAAAALPHRRARRRRRRADRRLPPRRAGADRRRPGRRARGGRACSPPRSSRFQLDGLAGPRRELPGPARPRAVRGAGAAQPDAVAAVHGDRRWTYRELNARANRMARALLRARAAPRGRRRGGDRAEPGLDGRRARGVQGRRRVPADRAALPGRPDRDHAAPAPGADWC